MFNIIEETRGGEIRKGGKNVKIPINNTKMRFRFSVQGKKQKVLEKV